MKNLLRLEEAAMLGLAICLAYQMDYPGWYYAAWFLAPDAAMIGYLINTKVGAFTYNLAHHKGIAIVIYLGGLYLGMPTLEFAGLVLFGHSAFDRIFGYGLKFSDNFRNTHLGWIGKANG